MASARRNRLLSQATYQAVAAQVCVYCLRPGKLGLDHVPPVTRSARPSTLGPGLFTYPACLECNLSLRAFAEPCIVTRARELHARAGRLRAPGPKADRAAARAEATLWATAPDAVSRHCQCRHCTSSHPDDPQGPTAPQRA